jgi:hypothetical protein
MKKRFGVYFMGLLMAASLPLSAAQDKKETDRLQNCGTVLKEILDIPDDIPQDLLDKADCVIVYPSVLKAAFVIGGSYGRGAMPDRRTLHRTVERADDDGARRRERRIPTRRTGDGLCAAGDEWPRRALDFEQQGEAGGGCFGGGGAEGSHSGGGDGRHDARGSTELFAFARAVRGHFARGLDGAAGQRCERARLWQEN